MVGLVNLYHSYESYRLGQAYGVEPETISKVLSKGTGATFWHSHAKDAVAQYDVVSRDPQYFRHVLHMSAENWGLAVSLGEDVGLKFPFLDAMISRVAEVDSGALWNEWRAFVEKAIQA